MYIVKRIIGFLMLVTPFAGAFYVTRRIVGLEASLMIWGACIAALTYLAVAVVLLFSQPRDNTEEKTDVKIRVLHQRLVDVEASLEEDRNVLRGMASVLKEMEKLIAKPKEPQESTPITKKKKR